MGGGCIQKDRKVKGGSRLHKTEDRRTCDILPQQRRPRAEGRSGWLDKVAKQQASNDNVKTSSQGVKFGVLMLSTCFHWREGWRP